MDLLSRDGQFRFYFGASYGSAQTALRRLEEPHIMLSQAISNNNPWEIYNRFQKSPPSLFIDNGAFSCFPDPGHYKTDSAEYLEYVQEAVDLVDDTTDVRYALRDIPTSPDVLDQLGITVADAQAITVDYHAKCLRYHHHLGLDATPVTVLQGRTPEDYLNHLERHIEADTYRNTIGIGSLASRDISEIQAIVSAVSEVVTRQTHIHGFGITPRVLVDSDIRWMLDSADSSKWSYGQYDDRVAENERLFHLMSKKYVDTKRTLTALFSYDTCEVEPSAKDDLDMELCSDILDDALRTEQIQLSEERIHGIPVRNQTERVKRA